MKKNNNVTIRLPEELKKFEDFGFSSMTDFVKSALIEYQKNHLSVVQKSSLILEQLSELISLLEIIRDEKSIGNISKHIDNPAFTPEMEAHHEACYRAAKEIASTELMLKNESNQVEVLKEIVEGWGSDRMYKYSWALSS